ncbi:hypothetical protein BV20DRAFT_969906 [Pilatotrama ljubarskyi]|nr:hypothetical protein BV20DRAFT_969906 [Pilatotrama ljubarskyi]
MPVRCYECKTALRERGAGDKHAELAGHKWQPEYYCTLCQATMPRAKDTGGAANK